MLSPSIEFQFSFCHMQWSSAITLPLGPENFYIITGIRYKRHDTL